MAEIDVSVLNEKTIAAAAAALASENAYHENIRKIAKTIKARDGLRAVLLAGPSGAGKTTTANLICDAVRALGEECMVVSLDNFYLDHKDPNYPKDDMGRLDYERPEALDLKMLQDALAAITASADFEIPRYDFKTSSRASIEHFPAMPEGCVIIEGLHALNPIISKKLSADKILKIFVSVSTNITDNKKRIISGRKVRFVRRLVRDSIFRSADAIRTLGLWRGVLAAEDIYLYPYKNLADISFDTFHIFELGAMKKTATDLIQKTEAKNDSYAKTVLDALEKINDFDAALIPENSLIREFIGGGIYEKIY